jgi:hypothetical protein
MLACGGSGASGTDTSSPDTAADATADGADVTTADAADATGKDGLDDVPADVPADDADATPAASIACRPCITDDDCDPGAHATCVAYGAAGSFCGQACQGADDCPALFDCAEVPSVGGATSQQCVPLSGACTCKPEFVTGGYVTACEVHNGFGTCQGERTCTEQGLSDCDAAVPAPEACNGADDDCDGATDEDVQGADAMIACKSEGVCAGGVQVVCSAGSWTCDYAAVAGYLELDVHCGECQDNDCDGATDEDAGACDETGPDLDCDGVLENDNCPAVPNPDQVNTDQDAAGDACDADDDNDGMADVDDCAPLDATTYPQAPELCDGADNDCNGTTDDGFADADLDGSADCVDPDDDDDGAPDGDDCAPLDPLVFPGNPELCDGLDQDCDDHVDEDSDGQPVACTLAGGEQGECLEGACVDPCAIGVDLPDDAFADTNCDGLDGDASRAIFVAPVQHGGDDFNPGTMDLPKLTIQGGIDGAIADGKTQVLVSAGTYPGPVTLKPGVSVFGGYHKPVGWKRSSEYVATVEVTAPDGDGRQVGVQASVIPVETPVLFDRMHVVLSDNGAVGGSNYGVHVVDGPGVTLSNLALEIGRAGTGASRTTPGAKPAASGSNGGYGGSGDESDSSAWCKSYGSPDTGDGANAPTCPYGTAAGWGGYGGSAGYHDGSGSSGGTGSDDATHAAKGGQGGSGHYSSGDSGWTGANGVAGADASGGTAFGAFSGGWYLPSDGGEAVASSDGSGGAGGGGGGGGGGGVNGTVFTCYGYGGAGGGGGSGGCGGQKGLSGDGGGAAFGVLALGAQPAMRAISASIGGGGEGGEASKGGDGSSGGYGGSGGGTYVTGASSGGKGGNGGSGGRGGHGGGGGGGPSFCVYYVLEAGEPDADLLVDVTCTNPGGGTGGTSPGNAGANGASGDTGFCLAAECAPAP